MRVEVSHDVPWTAYQDIVSLDQPPDMLTEDCLSCSHPTAEDKRYALSVCRVLKHVGERSDDKVRVALIAVCDVRADMVHKYGTTAIRVPLDCVALPEIVVATGFTSAG